MPRFAERTYNFSPGPAVLPLPVLEKVQKELLNYRECGASILEISHRSKEFLPILDETQQLFRQLTQLPDNYRLLFFSGGAQMQFSAVPLNLLSRSASNRASYAVTGKWGELALGEGNRYGSAIEWVHGRENRYNQIPNVHAEDLERLKDSAYLHLTSNNTLYGTQWNQFPQTGEVPLVIDATSDILSREVDFSQFGLVYASLQKNLGPAGLTLVVVREDLLGHHLPQTPKLLQYQAIDSQNSLNNTINVFAVYMMRYILEWYQKQGGVATMEQQNRQKAKLIYDCLDESDFFLTNVNPSDRSLVNVIFNLPTSELLQQFLWECEEVGLLALTGHREVGGVRASLYNALPSAAVERLVEKMRDFERKALT
jgi:phosphoserine aminotransferase